MEMFTVDDGKGGLADRGTKSNVTDSYGADLSEDATNKGMSIASMTGSDPMMATYCPTPDTTGSEGAKLGANGKSITSMTKSDAPEEEAMPDENFGSESTEGPWG